MIEGTEIFLMEIEDVAPDEYHGFATRRFLWKELGLHLDSTPAHIVAEALEFQRLEQLHPHRFQPEQKMGADQ